MAFPLLKFFSVGVVAALILSTATAELSWSENRTPLPDKAHPLHIDVHKEQVLVYTEVNPKNQDKANPHWGVVYRGGKLSDKAILLAYCTPEEFHQGLMKIGARPGNNLTLNQTDAFVRGDALSVTAFRPDLNKSLALADIISDQSGKGFHIRFGGNLERAAKEKTGCITCLESCPVGITSNAAYPAISSWKRFLSPNSLFKGKTENLPMKAGVPVILIYQLINPKHF